MHKGSDFKNIIFKREKSSILWFKSVLYPQKQSHESISVKKHFSYSPTSNRIFFHLAVWVHALEFSLSWSEYAVLASRFGEVSYF